MCVTADVSKGKPFFLIMNHVFGVKRFDSSSVGDKVI